MIAVVCALGAALLYATASVLQQRSAAEAPAEKSLRIGLLTRLLRNPVWLLGIAADIAGFVLQFVALSSGTLVLVQPLLVVGLLFALPIGARVNGSPMARSDWLSAVAVCAGLAVFQAVADPSAGRDSIGLGPWVLLIVAAGGLGVILAVIGSQVAGRPRALLLSAAAGTVYGMAAALTKNVGHLLGQDVVGTLAHWQPYALATVGVGGMVIAQSAFQAGTLDVSLPTMTVVDPVVSILIGSLAFDERLASGPVPVTAEVVSLIVMAAGVYALARTTAARRSPQRVGS